MVKKRQFEDDDEEEEQFHVEVITKARVNKEGQWEYRVKWAGYPSDADSWEPSENVEGCERLLKSFWKEVGHDDEDYEEGYVAEASPDWIAREKQFFHENFGRPQKVVKKKKKRRNSKPPKPPVGKAVVKKNAKGRTTLKKPVIASDTEYEDSEDDSDAESDDKPLIKNELKKKTRKRSVAPSTDSDDSDQPLRKAPRKQHSVSIPKVGKGKESVRPRPTTPPANDVNSLFSAPSSPEVSINKKKLPEAAAKASSSRTASGSMSKPSTSTSTAQSAAPPPKPALGSHKNREPKVKLMPLQITGDASFTDTKRKLAERAGTFVEAKTPTAGPSTGSSNLKKSSLAGLSFKKKTTAETHVSAPAPPPPVTDPRRKPSTNILTDAQRVDSPASATVGNWGDAGGGWGNTADSSTGGGWGNTVDNSTSGWGNTADNSTSGWGNTADNSTSGWGNTADNSSGGGWGNTVDSSTGGGAGSGWGQQTSPKQTHFVPTGLRSGAPQSGSRPPAAVIDKNKAAAEAFLADIMPKEMRAPMHEPTGDEMDLDVAPPPKPPVQKKPQVAQQTTQSWEWSGDLYMETAPKKSAPAARLCSIRLAEPSLPRPNGLRLSVCYDAKTSVLKLEKFYETSDLFLLLRACDPVQQFSKVLPKEADEESTLKTFAAYMTRRRQFACARALLEGDQVGLLLLFSPSVPELCDNLKVPARMRNAQLLAALVPWKLTVEQYQQHEWQGSHHTLKPEDGRIDPQFAAIAGELAPMLTAKPQLATGLRLHHFSAADHDFFTRGQRNYCLWHAPADGSAKEPGFETRALVAVLGAWHAQDVGHKKDARVVFVHVGALRSLPKMEAIAMRRCKRPEVRFYSYGTHASVPPERWGVREIYPIGGVVTFTAKAIVEDPFQIYKLIEQISQHPLWMCYVHPCVVAAVARLSYPSTNVMTLIKRDNFFYSPLLKFISEGKVALLHAPPKSRHARLDKNSTAVMINPASEWLEWTLSTCSMDVPALMQECLRIFDARHPKLADKDVATVVEQELLADMVQMQLEPVIMDNHRRFVMAAETRNDQTLESHGVELVPASKFDFKDDYFAAA